MFPSDIVCLRNISICTLHKGDDDDDDDDDDDNNNNMAVELSLLLRNEVAQVQVSVPGLAGLT